MFGWEFIKPIDRNDQRDPAAIESPGEFPGARRRDVPLYEMPDKACFATSRFRDGMRAVLDTRTFSSNLDAVLQIVGDYYSQPGRGVIDAHQ